MMDARGRDQFVIRYQDATEICWNDAQRTQVGMPFCLGMAVLRRSPQNQAFHTSHRRTFPRGHLTWKILSSPTLSQSYTL